MKRFLSKFGTPREYATGTRYRGVILFVGKKKGVIDEAEDSDTSEVISTIVFERSLFNEHSASVWRRLHRQHFIAHD